MGGCAADGEWGLWAGRSLQVWEMNILQDVLPVFSEWKITTISMGWGVVTAGSGDNEQTPGPQLAGTTLSIQLVHWSWLVFPNKPFEDFWKSIANTNKCNFPKRANAAQIITQLCTNKAGRDFGSNSAKGRRTAGQRKS